MRAEFEEKEFEAPLNAQLSNLFWPPGQVLEEIIGFDAALMVDRASFWALHGRIPPVGGAVQGVWWPQEAFAPNTFPTYRVNAFIQHKRPEYLRTAAAAEWATWGRAYYRFEITDHQQVALEACALGVGRRGIVLYASPVFHTKEELFAHQEENSLEAHTHFVRAARLAGHKKYTYVSARTPGVAHSDPVKVDPLVFVDIPAGPRDPPGRRGGGEGAPPGPLEILQLAMKGATQAVEASPMSVGSEALFRAAVGRSQQAADRLNEVRTIRGPNADFAPRAIEAFVVARTFERMANLTWAVTAAID